MTVLDATLLVVAKAPVPGLAKTRLAATLGNLAAADLAAAALLDTLDAVASTPVARRVVALTGELSDACRSVEIRSRLGEFTVVPQRGDGFARRLANAHRDAAGGGPVLQIGMDTPQITPDLLGECVRSLLGATAALGRARDGGWWALGVADSAYAQSLVGVPMSRSDTAAITAAALIRSGAAPVTLPVLTDVDDHADLAEVRAQCEPGSRFARAAAAVV